MTYFKVLPDTNEYNIAYSIFHYVDNWIKPEVSAAFKEIGIEVNKNLICFPSVLELKTIPEGTRSQFKKNKTNNVNGQAYVAKKNSPLNKQFLEIVKKFHLTYHDYIEFLFRFKYHAKIILYPLNKATNFYIEIPNLNKCFVDEYDYFKNHSSLIELSESEFLELKLKSVKENGT